MTGREDMELSDELFIADDPPREIDAPGTPMAAPTEAGHRYALTSRLIWITAGLGVAILATAVWAPPAAWERVDRVGTLVLVPFQTLVGIAIGWYFSERKRAL